ncbi:hypothetical protein [Thioalkalivibrio paradoxus]|nr:hypothetical protein [Thioalkalivibrio paradoxus]
MIRFRTFGLPVFAMLALGTNQAALADSEQELQRGAGADDAGLLMLAQQTPRSTFRGQPEYPPPDYLAEFEEGEQRETQRQRQDSGQRFDPRSVDRGQAAPEFAPGGYDRSLPGRAGERAQTPRTDFGSVTGYGSAPATPGTMPRRGDYGEPRRGDYGEPRRGDYGDPYRPGAVPGDRGRMPDPRDRRPPTTGAGEYPGDQPRWPERPPAPTGEHQWPTAPGGSYLTRPEFPSAQRERSRPDAPSRDFPDAPEFPAPGRGSFDWQR